MQAPFSIPEFQRSNMPRGRQHCFPHGPTAALISERITFDNEQENQSHDFLYFRQFFKNNVNSIRSCQTVQIPEDYYFHLEEVRIWVKRRYLGYWTPPLYFKLWQIANGRELSDLFVDCHIVSTPDCNIELPGTNLVNAHNRHCISWNHLFLPHDTIQMCIEIGYIGGEYLLDWLEPIEATLKGIRIPVQTRLQETR